MSIGYPHKGLTFAVGRGIFASDAPRKAAEPLKIPTMQEYLQSAIDRECGGEKPLFVLLDRGRNGMIEPINDGKAMSWEDALPLMQEELECRGGGMGHSTYVDGRRTAEVDTYNMNQPTVWTESYVLFWYEDNEYGPNWQAELRNPPMGE